MSVRVNALNDLLRRYASAFRHAWRSRAAMEPVERLSHEAQFLPAALALQETPVSPTPRVAMWLIITFAGLALVWAVVGRIDVVATAQGRVVPNHRSKTIQSFETATVRAIHVTDGQSILAGDVLIELDATNARADRERIQSDLGAARLQVARARVLIASLNGGQALGLKRPLGVTDPAYQEAQRLLTAQVSEYRAKLARVEAEIDRRDAELRTNRERMHGLERAVPIAQQRASDLKNLLDQQFVSRHAYLEQEQRRIEQEADLAMSRNRMAEIGAALREARAQYAELVAETRRHALDSLADGQQRVVALQQELTKVELRDRLMRISAPVDGTVQQLAVHTVGGVVTPAQPLMVIVPGDDSLEVEAFVDNKDIGFVRVGQRAEVKIETFQYTKYGTIPARVTSVSHDAINDEKRGLIYSSLIKLDRTVVDVEGSEVGLAPGMSVSVEVKIAKRRVIEYFLAPLIQHVNESLRER